MSAATLIARLKALWTAPALIHGESRALTARYSSPEMAQPIDQKIRLVSKAERKAQRVAKQAQKKPKFRVVSGGRHQ